MEDSRPETCTWFGDKVMVRVTERAWVAASDVVAVEEDRETGRARVYLRTHSEVLTDFTVAELLWLPSKASD